MHMWIWLGYDVGDFLFYGINIVKPWSFALTWFILFICAFLFEGSKVYVARTQKEATKILYPYRSVERRQLLSRPEDPGTSRNEVHIPINRWTTIKYKVLVNLHQTVVYMAHNTVGYLLMIAVMVYNLYLILAVVFGMMLGYLVFGPALTRLQMECSIRTNVNCTPECDENAEGTTPPLLHASMSSDTDYFVCGTRTCVTPTQYYTTHQQDEASASTSTTASKNCHYGAKNCPSKVAVAKRYSEAKYQEESEKEDGSNIEDVQLLQKERKCCKNNEEIIEISPDNCCSSKGKKEIAKVEVYEGASGSDCCKNEEIKREEEGREESPQISCCNTKSLSASQERIS